jgi:hypothetical protein
MNAASLRCARNFAFLMSTHFLHKYYNVTAPVHTGDNVQQLLQVQNYWYGRGGGWAHMYCEYFVFGEFGTGQWLESITICYFVKIVLSNRAL